MKLTRPARIALTCCAGLALAGCAPDANAGAACTPASNTQSTVMVRLGFVRQGTDDPRVDGFDLDGRVSTTSDNASCRQADFTSHDGTPGIDNQLAKLLPIVDSMTGGALEGAVQGAINNGQQLLAISIEGLDNRCNDDAVTVVIQRVSGTPFVGADMLLDPWQTFDAQRELPPTRVPARIRDGYVEAGPFTLPLPISVLTASFTLNLYEARIRARIEDDGGLVGLIGGGVDREEFMTEVRTLIISQSLMSSISGELSIFADLDRDATGHCTRLSAAVQVTTRPAFVNP